MSLSSKRHKKKPTTPTALDLRSLPGKLGNRNQTKSYCLNVSYNAPLHLLKTWKIHQLFVALESRANLQRHRGNHGRVASRCMSSSPTPPKPGVVFFSGPIPVRFFSWGRGPGVRGGPPLTLHPASQPTNQISTTFCKFRRRFKNLKVVL